MDTSIPVATRTFAPAPCVPPHLRLAALCASRGGSRPISVRSGAGAARATPSRSPQRELTAAVGAGFCDGPLDCPTSFPGAHLNPAQHFIQLAFNVLQVAIREFRPLLFQPAAGDVPVAFDFEFRHGEFILLPLTHDGEGFDIANHLTSLVRPALWGETLPAEFPANLRKTDWRSFSGRAIR